MSAVGIIHAAFFASDSSGGAPIFLERHALGLGAHDVLRFTSNALNGKGRDISRFHRYVDPYDDPAISDGSAPRLWAEPRPRS